MKKKNYKVWDQLNCPTTNVIMVTNWS